MHIGAKMLFKNLIRISKIVGKSDQSREAIYNSVPLSRIAPGFVRARNYKWLPYFDHLLVPERISGFIMLACLLRSFPTPQMVAGVVGSVLPDLLRKLRDVCAKLP